MEEAKKTLRELFSKQSLGVLASVGEVYPRTNLVAFVVFDDLKKMLFATPRFTRKYCNVKKNPQVSVLVDNRSNDVADFTDAVAVSVFGDAVEVIEDRQKYLDIYLAKHPYLDKFVASPTCVFFEIQVKYYDIISRFQNVRILEMENKE